jgi:hypothetical protein
MAAVVLATACTLLVSSYTPIVAPTTAADAQATAAGRNNSPITLVVGRLLRCQGTAQMSLQQLTAAAQQAASGLAQAETAAVLNGASGLVQVGCSMQRHPKLARESSQPDESVQLQSTDSSWKQGPYQQQQTLQVTGLDALDCILLEEQSVVETPYVFLLQNSGECAWC